MTDQIRQALKKLGWTPEWQETLEDLLDDGSDVIAFAEEQDEIDRVLARLEGQHPGSPKENTTERPTKTLA